MRTLILLTAFAVLSTSVLADATGPSWAKPARGSSDEVVCHRQEVTGSLARMVKTCMTRAQWAAQSDAAQAQTAKVEELGRINSCGAQTLGGCQ